MTDIVAWDLETGVPDGMTPIEYEILTDLRKHEDPPQYHDPFELWPFPVTVGATSVDRPGPVSDVVYSHRRAEGLGKAGVLSFLQGLAYAVKKGYKLVGWNTSRFDFPVLGRITGEWDLCRELCLQSYDLPYQVLRTEGYMIGQDPTCRGLGLPGKPRVDMGAQAPVLWAHGYYQEVEDYCASDVDQLRRIFQYGEKYRHIKWFNRNDELRAYPLPVGWVPMSRLLQLKPPDQSWQTNPIGVEEGVEWLIG